MQIQVVFAWLKFSRTPCEPTLHNTTQQLPMKKHTFLVICTALGFFAFPASGATVAISQTTTLGTNTNGSSVTAAIDILGTTDWKVWNYNGSGLVTEQMAGSTVIGALSEVGTHPASAPNTNWDFVTFTWAAGGDPTASSTGYTAGFATSNARNVGMGYTVGLTLPEAAGTITFWGTTRESDYILTVRDSSSDVLGSLSTGSAPDTTQFGVTTWTVDWSGATVGEQISLEYVTGPGASNASPRVGVAGIAVSVIPEPSTALLGGLGLLALLHRRRA